MTAYCGSDLDNYNNIDNMRPIPVPISWLKCCDFRSLDFFLVWKILLKLVHSDIQRSFNERSVKKLRFWIFCIKAIL